VTTHIIINIVEHIRQKNLENKEKQQMTFRLKNALNDGEFPLRNHRDQETAE
jgi:hypothetical protein